MAAPYNPMNVGVFVTPNDESIAVEAPPDPFGDPMTNFLMGAGQGLLQAGGWSRMPVGLGQAMGAGLQGGMKSYRDAVIAQRAAQQQRLQEGLQRAQIAKLQRDANAEVQQQQFLSTLPESERVRAAAMGVPEYIKAQGGSGDWLEGTSTTAQMFNTYENVLNRLQNGEPVTPREYQRAVLAHRQLTAPRTTLNQQGEAITVQADYPALPAMPGTAPLTPVTVEQADETTVSQGGRPVAQEATVTTQGGTKITRRQVGTRQLSQEDKKTLVNSRSALEDLDLATGMLFEGLTSEGTVGPQSELRETVALSGSLNVPKSQGRTARQAIRRAVEILLRMRTGAAAPDTEVDNYTDMYSPSVLDSDQGARLKMQRLRKLFTESQQLAETGQFAYQGGDVEGKAEDLLLPEYREADAAGQQSGIAQPKTRADVESLPSGTQFMWQGQVMVRN